MKIKSKKDLYSGLMFIFIGAFFAIGATQYPMGTAVRMGPAYFPTGLGWICAILGIIIAARGLTTEGEAPRPTQWGTMGWVLGSVLIFGWLIEPLKVGFIGAVVISCVACAYGGYEFKWKEAIIEAIILVVVCWAAFVWGLGLPFRLWPWS